MGSKLGTATRGLQMSHPNPKTPYSPHCLNSAANFAASGLRLALAALVACCATRPGAAAATAGAAGLGVLGTISTCATHPIAII